jgi:hypothetical protein
MSLWDTREDLDGFTVSHEGGLVAYFKKSDGWTRPLVEEAVDSLTD